jgi:hypothetical protein
VELSRLQKSEIKVVSTQGLTHFSLHLFRYFCCFVLFAFVFVVLSQGASDMRDLPSPVGTPILSRKKNSSVRGHGDRSYSVSFDWFLFADAATFHDFVFIETSCAIYCQEIEPLLSKGKQFGANI